MKYSACLSFVIVIYIKEILKNLRGGLAEQRKEKTLREQYVKCQGRFLVPDSSFIETKKERNKADDLTKTELKCDLNTK